MLPRGTGEKGRGRVRAALRVSALAVSAALLAACALPTDTPPQATARATPAAKPALALRVVQTIHNAWTGRQTESVFDESVYPGESYKVENMSGTWSLTFSVESAQGDGVTLRTNRPMLPYAEDGGEGEPRDAFTVPFGEPLRLGEPALPDMVWYTFTFMEQAASAGDEPAVRFTDRQILSNIRRTLHESRKSTFTRDELMLIRFVELRGAEATDVAELHYLPNIETLTLKDTGVTDLSPLVGCKTLHTLALLENAALDYRTMPALPGLRLLFVTGALTEADVMYLEALLPACSIVTDMEKETHAIS